MTKIIIDRDELADWIDANFVPKQRYFDVAFGFLVSPYSAFIHTTEKPPTAESILTECKFEVMES